MWRTGGSRRKDGETSANRTLLPISRNQELDLHGMMTKGGALLECYLRSDRALYQYYIRYSCARTALARDGIELEMNTILDWEPVDCI